MWRNTLIPFLLFIFSWMGCQCGYKPNRSDEKACKKQADCALQESCVASICIKKHMETDQAKTNPPCHREFAKKEECDGLDNDCDGKVDGFTIPCFSGPQHARNQGICKTGLQFCNQGVWTSCQGEILPEPALSSQRPEKCDGLDNNCNGQVDESCLCTEKQTQSCGTDIGLCSKGTQICNQGRWGECVGGHSPSKERCNNLDDDCDGEVDEDFPLVGQNCTLGVGSCQIKSKYQCSKDKTSFVCGDEGTLPKREETCNAKDDDCDGKVDNIEPIPCYEGSQETKGIAGCKSGQKTCRKGTWSKCEGQVLPGKEECNAKDDDCDGQVDEELFQFCSASKNPNIGQCKQGKKTCTAGTWSSCQGEVTASAEVCDDKDNDCDGQVDEELTGCALSKGFQLFSTGAIESKDVIFDGKSSFYITGIFQQDVYLESTKESSKGGYDIFLAKVTSQGKLEWLRTYGSSEKDHAIKVRLDKQKNVLLWVEFGGSVTIGKKTIKKSPSNFLSCLFKISPTGALLATAQLPASSTRYQYVKVFNFFVFDDDTIGFLVDPAKPILKKTRTLSTRFRSTFILFDKELTFLSEKDYAWSTTDSSWTYPSYFSEVQGSKIRKLVFRVEKNKESWIKHPSGGTSKQFEAKFAILDVSKQGSEIKLKGTSKTMLILSNGELPRNILYSSSRQQIISSDQYYISDFPDAKKQLSISTIVQPRDVDIKRLFLDAKDNLLVVSRQWSDFWIYPENKIMQGDYLLLLLNSSGKPTLRMEMRYLGYHGVQKLLQGPHGNHFILLDTEHNKLLLNDNWVKNGEKEYRRTFYFGPVPWQQIENNRNFFKPGNKHDKEWIVSIGSFFSDPSTLSNLTLSPKSQSLCLQSPEAVMIYNPSGKDTFYKQLSYRELQQESKVGNHTYMRFYSGSADYRGDFDLTDNFLYPNYSHKNHSTVTDSTKSSTPWTRQNKKGNILDQSGKVAFPYVGTDAYAVQSAFFLRDNKGNFYYLYPQFTGAITYWQWKTYGPSFAIAYLDSNTKQILWQKSIATQDVFFATVDQRDNSLLILSHNDGNIRKFTDQGKLALETAHNITNYARYSRFYAYTNHAGSLILSHQVSQQHRTSTEAFQIDTQGHVKKSRAFFAGKRYSQKTKGYYQVSIQTVTSNKDNKQQLLIQTFETNETVRGERKIPIPYDATVNDFLLHPNGFLYFFGGYSYRMKIGGYDAVTDGASHGSYLARVKLPK